jgi:hypothetical protein
MVGQFLV